MKCWDQMPWSPFFECWVLSQLFHYCLSACLSISLISANRCLRVKNPPANAGDAGDPGLRPRFNPWVEKIPWRRKWQSTLLFLPGKSHGQKSLAGLQSMGSQRDTTEHTAHSAWYCYLKFEKLDLGTSLVVQCLGLYSSSAGALIPSLVEEVGSYMSHSQKKKKKNPKQTKNNSSFQISSGPKHFV